MIYKGYTITADCKETVYTEYELLDWDTTDTEIQVTDSSDFEILEYIVYGPDDSQHYFGTPEEAKEYIDKETADE